MRLERKGVGHHTRHEKLRFVSFLQRFLLDPELDFRETWEPSSMTISTCTPNGHHHSCSSGVVRSGTP